MKQFNKNKTLGYVYKITIALVFLLTTSTMVNAQCSTAWKIELDWSPYHEDGFRIGWYFKDVNGNVRVDGNGAFTFPYDGWNWDGVINFTGTGPLTGYLNLGGMTAGRPKYKIYNGSELVAQGTFPSTGPSKIDFNNLTCAAGQCNTAAPTATSPQTFCGSAKVSDLTATGTSIKWYAAASGGTALSTSTALTNNGKYYATQTIGSCESTTRKEVVVNLTTTTLPTASSQSFCASDLATVANLVASGTGLKWYNSSASTTPLSTSTLLVSGTYYVTQTVGGCESSKRSVSVTITDPSAPTVSASQTLCVGATVADLVATGNNLQWYDAGNNLLSSSTALTNGGKYYATETSGTCESAKTTAVTVTLMNPSAPAISGSQTLCVGATVANLAGTNVKWYDASNNALTPTTALVDGGKYYAAGISGTCESTNKTEVTVTLTPNTVAIPVVSDQEFCVSAAATVADLVGTGSNLQWYDASDNLLALTDALIDGDKYYATANNGICESGKVEITVSISDDAQPITNAAQTLCESSTVADLVATGNNLQWYDAGNNLLSSSTALTNGGKYYATQTNGICESSKAEVTVTLTPNTVAAPVASDQEFCASASATVADLVGTGNNLQWYDVNNNLLASTDALVDGEKYYVTANDGICESEKIEILVSVSDDTQPVADAAQTLCENSTIADLVAIGNNLQWYDASNNLLVSTTALITGGKYYATQTNGACTSSKAEVTVTLIPNTVADPITSNQDFCGPTTVADLVATGANIQWYDSNDNVLASADFIVNGEKYYATANDGICESDKVEILVSIKLSEITLTATDETCSGKNDGTATVNDPSGTPGITYLWFNGETSSSIENLTAGKYNVSIDDGTGCILDTSVTINTIGNYIDFTVSPEKTTIVKGEEVNILVDVETGTVNENYQWTPTEGLSCVNCFNPIASPEETTTYYITVISEHGCETTDSIVINVENDCVPIFVPDMFSPNDDGINDQLSIFGGDCTKDFAITIYNRWGEVIYHSEDKAESWDGKHKGRMLNAGIYVYKLTYKDTKTNKEVKESGNINLVR